MKSNFVGLSDFSIGERTLRNTSPMMQGEDVRYVQMRVRTAPDAVFGPKTETAVKVFQQYHGLPATGVVDAATWAKIKVTKAPEGSNVAGIPSILKNPLILGSAGAVLAVGIGLVAAKRRKK